MMDIHFVKLLRIYITGIRIVDPPTNGSTTTAHTLNAVVWALIRTRALGYLATASIALSKAGITAGQGLPTTGVPVLSRIL